MNAEHGSGGAHDSERNAADLAARSGPADGSRSTLLDKVKSLTRPVSDFLRQSDLGVVEVEARITGDLDATPQVVETPTPLDQGVRADQADEPVYRLVSRVLLEREDGGETIIVIDTRLGSICTSNAAASFLLPMLQEGARLHDLAARLSARFGIPEQHAWDDVRAFLSQLAGMGFVDESDS